MDRRCIDTYKLPLSPLLDIGDPANKPAGLRTDDPTRFYDHANRLTRPGGNPCHDRGCHLPVPVEIEFRAILIGKAETTAEIEIFQSEEAACNACEGIVALLKIFE